MPSTPVSIATDISMPFIPTLITAHNFAWVTPPSSGVTACLEIPVTIMWAPGFALALNKLTTTVLHKFLPIALDGHNCGVMIPHVTIPPAPLNTLLPLQILFSSRKMAFSSSKVKANKAQVACTFVGLLPMTCCANPVTLPTGAAPLNIANNVNVGLTWMDILAGFVALAANMVLEYVTRSAPKVPTGKTYLEKFLVPLTAKGWKDWAKKTAVGLLTSGARIAMTGEGTLQVKVGSDYVNVSISLARTTEGNWSFAVAGQAGAPVSPFGAVAAGQAKYQHDWNADGSSTDAVSASASAGQPLAPGGVAGRESYSNSTTTDAAGNESTKVTTGTQVVAAEPGAGYASNSSEVTSSAPGKTPSTSNSGYEGGNAFGSSWGRPL